MQMLKDANGGQVPEEKMRQAAVGISGGSRDNASRGIRRSLKELGPPCVSAKAFLAHGCWRIK
jgi:hypothetical protein